MEILSFGVQAPGLDPGLGEMFRFVGPTLGNRALFVKIDLPPSQICKEFPWACNTAWGQGLRGRDFYGEERVSININPCATLRAVC